MGGDALFAAKTIKAIDHSTLVNSALMGCDLKFVGNHVVKIHPVRKLKEQGGDRMLKIRQYQPSDKEAVWDLHNMALSRVGAHLGPGPWDDDFQNVEGVYLANNGEFLVGEYEGQVVAMGALKKTSNELAEIKRMRVHPSFQGRHFGTAILEALEGRAKEIGYKALHLDTTIKQDVAQILYKNHGFREATRESDTIFMERTLI